VQFAFADRPPAKALAAFKASPRYRRFQEIMAARPKGFTSLRDGKGPKGIPWLAPDDFAPRDYRGGLVAWRRADAASLELYPLVADKLEFKMPDWVAVSREPGAKLYRVAAKPTAGPGGLKPYAIEVRGGTDGQVQKLTGTFMTAEWDVRWYTMGRPKKLAYDDAEGWKRLFESAPLARQTTRELSANLWANGFPKDVPHNDFAIVASTKVQLPAGRYHFSTLSDDGIRVFLDGKEIISRWNHHGAAPD
jgi:hypothetical protein